jgi:hypothetical protein
VDAEKLFLSQKADFRAEKSAFWLEKSAFQRKMYLSAFILSLRIRPWTVRLYGNAEHYMMQYKQKFKKSKG